MAMTYFRDPVAVDAALQALLSRAFPIVDGFPLLMLAGQKSPATRQMRFQFLKTHYDEIMRDRPSIFGFHLGSFLPRAGQSYCDEKSTDELKAFFGAIVKYPGAQRNLAQVVEPSICGIAKRPLRPQM